VKYWICPKCACLTQLDRAYCDNCHYPQEALDLAEALGIKKLTPEFKDTLALDTWIKTARQYLGAKVWRV
jgi:hypothetical protein